MKRSGMPRRCTALRPGGPLKRTELKRKRRLRGRRPKVSPEEKHGKEVAGARSGGVCEVQIPSVCLGQAETFHHRLNKGQGGSWSPENLLHTCGDGTRGCHGWITGERIRSRPRGWMVKEHELATPAEVPVWRRDDAWVLLTADGGLVPVLHHAGGPDDCEAVLDRPGEPGLRCGLGELHDGDHECGLVRWPYTSEERASV